MHARTTRALTLVAGTTLAVVALGGWSPAEPDRHLKGMEVPQRIEYDPRTSAAYSPPASEYRSVWELVATSASVR